MKKRPIWYVAVLTFVSLGIYFVVWSTLVQKEIFEKTKKGFEWPMHLVMIFASLGFYIVYWCFAIGTRTELLGAKNNDIWYCLLSIFFLHIVVVIWVQYLINNLEEKKTE